MSEDTEMNLKDVMFSDVGYAEIAIDPNGEVCIFEGGCYWSGDGWHPIDDYDGLAFKYLGSVGTIGHEKAKKSRWRLCEIGPNEKIVDPDAEVSDL